MTIDDLQKVLEAAGFSVDHMGWSSRAARGAAVTRWSVVLVPETGGRRRAEDVGLRIRAVGPTLTAALEDALTKLGAHLLVGRRAGAEEGGDS